MICDTVHEVAHGFVARKLGDNIAMMMGRMTLNPLKHIDPFGTVLVPVTMYLLTGLLFGWAKPVPVNFHNLRNPRRDMTLVAAAGPVANLVMAIVWVILMRLGMWMGESVPWVVLPLIYMGGFGLLINVVLMVLNLLPVLPLDGGRVMSSLLPPRLSLKYALLEPYGMIIIVGLLFTGILGKIIWPPVQVLQGAIRGLVGL